ncbi:subtilisin family serine protease [Nocardioides cavernae]|uniref:Subtilisin family serine protease n=1 Tax=Nocardioides cavernae TaxID=1921566 RepID=A0A7Y9H6K5_9ACTN|nr:S8/S53 family peptidase [Nocardioides cavernae]NYE38835.1 subtilisin family serine protease [Nocardioides cavernae]
MGDWKIGDDKRRRSTDQLRDLNEANRGQVAWDTEAPADFTYLYHPDHVLVEIEDVEEFEAAVDRLDKGVLGEPPRRDDVRLLDGELVRYVLPERAGGESVPDVLDLLEAGGLRHGVATPDHWVHVSPGGGGQTCPATEPEETGLAEPWPAVQPQDEGRRVSVVVVDTGWNPASGSDGRTPWLKGVEGDDEDNRPDLRPYAGHGTFIAGVVRCVAPRTDVWVEGFAVGGVGGGGILESEIVGQLVEAMRHDPQVINLSAGCRTRRDLPSKAFARFHRKHLKGADCVLVAAAGNDSWAAPFWPAAFRWAVGVGSLDRDGRVSEFSNYGVSADVYTVGRNLVNAYPDGTFVCHETPNKGDVRVFSTGMARWSGTSFAAPVVAGMIAREISETGCSATDARDAVLARAVRDSDPLVGPHLELPLPGA